MMEALSSPPAPHKSARIIAVMNQKGGVGKTTTTVNLGAALVELGKRVCAIDLDPQAHLTINYGLEPRTEGMISLYDVLVEDRSLLEAVHQSAENVAVVPSSIDLAGAEVELVSVPGRDVLLRERLDAARTTEEFDYILIDCPPSLGVLTINALAAADEVIIPMQPQFFPLQGVAKLLETVQLVQRRINPKLKVTGVVLTMFDAQTKLSGEVVNELNTFIAEAQGRNLPWSNARVFETRIRRNIKLAESPSFGQTIFKYGPNSNGAADYRAFAREVDGSIETAAEVSRAVTAPPAAATADPPAAPAKVEVAISPAIKTPENPITFGSKLSA